MLGDAALHLADAGVVSRLDHLDPAGSQEVLAAAEALRFVDYHTRYLEVHDPPRADQAGGERGIERCLDIALRLSGPLQALNLAMSSRIALLGALVVD